MPSITKKYELLPTETLSRKNQVGQPLTLYRIRALRDIALYGVKTGDLGGFVQSEHNLDQSPESNAWIFHNAHVFENSKVFGNARITQNALVFGDALVFDNTNVYNNAQVYDDAQVYGNASIGDDAKIFQNAKLYDNARVYERAYVFNFAQVYGNAQMYGRSQAYDSAHVCEHAQLSGISIAQGSTHVTDDLWGDLMSTDHNRHIQLLADDTIPHPRNSYLHLKRIQAIRDIPAHNIKKGDWGGYAQHTANLDGPDSWVAPHAFICDHAVISGQAIALEYSQITNNAYVGGSSTLHQHSWITDNAQVLNNGHIWKNAHLSGTQKWTSPFPYSAPMLTLYSILLFLSALMLVSFSFQLSTHSHPPAVATAGLSWMTLYFLFKNIRCMRRKYRKISPFA